MPGAPRPRSGVQGCLAFRETSECPYGKSDAVTRLDRYRNAHGQIWLNVASSVYVLEDFVNFDNHVLLWLLRLPPALGLLPPKYREHLEAYSKASKTALLLKHDCRKPLPLPEGVADHILCSHFLEHVFP